MPGASAIPSATQSGINDVPIGGGTHTAAGREAARRIEARYPKVRDMAAAGHAFGLRTIRAAGEVGIRRFIRAGYVTWLPPNTHDAVRAVAPDCQVVYVTRGDQAAVALELLGPEHGVTVVRAPVKDPREVLAAPPVAQMLAAGEPVCLVVGILMHFAAPRYCAEHFRLYAQALPPGSVVAMSLIAVPDEETAGELGALFGLPLYAHTAEGCAGWLDGAQVVHLTPGITVPGTALGVVARTG